MSPVLTNAKWRCTDLSGPEQEGVCLMIDAAELDLLLAPAVARQLGRALEREAKRAEARMRVRGTRPFRALTFDASPSRVST